MADWIKMRSDLYRHPKVCVIADLLMSDDSDLARYVNQNKQRDMTVTRNVMRNVTVGALVSVWGIIRHRGKRVEDDLVVAGAAVSVIDDLSDIPGFGDAMQAVGWVVVNRKSLCFPRFFAEHNVDPEQDQKTKNALRQQRYRDKQNNVTRNVTVAPQSNDRIEKSKRESKSGDSSIEESQCVMKFVPPTVAEVAAYCTEKANGIDPVKFVNFYTAKGWMIGKNKMKDWKAAITTWTREDRSNGNHRTTASERKPDPRFEFVDSELAE